MATGSEWRNARLSYTYQPRDPCTGLAVGDPVTVSDPPCDAACDLSAGPGLYYVTRLFHPDTCVREDPVCTKAPACPLAACP